MQRRLTWASLSALWLALVTHARALGGLHRGVQMWSFIILIYVVRTFVGQLMFCAVMNLINNSVDVYNMGAANGLGACVCVRVSYTRA